MSYLFDVYRKLEDGGWKLKCRCVCYELGEALSYRAYEHAQPYTYEDLEKLSADDDPECKTCADRLRVSNANAEEFLVWLGLTPDIDAPPVKATEVAALCRRRLWPEARNEDQGRDGSDTKDPGKPRVIEGGRPAGRFKYYAEKLLVLAEKAGDDYVGWG